MSLSGLVEIPRSFDVAQGRLQEKRGFVMPAKAGIHLWFRWQGKEDLDSGPGSGPGQALRRNDERKSRLLVDAFRTSRLGAKGHPVVNNATRYR